MLFLMAEATYGTLLRIEAKLDEVLSKLYWIVPMPPGPPPEPPVDPPVEES